MKEVIHIEFDMDDDVEVQPKNAIDGNAEGKVQYGAPDLFITVLIQDLIVLHLHSAWFWFWW